MMSDDASGFGKLVPGFDFLQNLVKNAGAALPGIGQWVAPTLDPAELEKRISELRTVQFWLEQNARMLAATIQALEVQRMTLSTLKTMNVPMADLRDTLMIKPAQADAPKAAATAKPAATAPAAPAPGNAVDPMQWWGALTSQFTQLATHAMKDGAAASLMARFLTPHCTTAVRASRSMATMRLNLARLSVTPSGFGSAPPESPVPAPRATTGTPSRWQAQSTAATSASVSGRATTSGCSR